jgi:PKD repeat protein
VNVADAMVAYSGDIPNEPPVVKIMASPIQGRAPLAVTFTASASDPDGTIAHYLWSFSTGETNSVPSFVHTFKKAGDITVMVTVTDDLGASGSDQTTIHVTPGEKHSGGAKSGGCAVGGMGGVESLLFMSWSLLALARRRRRG